jgi:hypothetical protein
MRKKATDYLANPSPKKLAKLTTMEQKWIDAQVKGKDKKPAK